MKLNELDLNGKTVLLRVDFNVPINNGIIEDDTRIRKALPTIEYLLENDAKIVVLSHLGRPERSKDSLGRMPRKKFSLKPVADYLDTLINAEVAFCDDTIGEKVKKAVDKLESGEILVLENTRFYEEERAGEEKFAEEISNLGDIYVNDAFGTAHRAHATTAIIAQFYDREHKAFGFLMEKEIIMADKVLYSDEHPKVAIIGGAKVSDKISLINALVDKVDTILIGGGMAYTFVKSFGGEIGNSLVDLNKLALAKQIFSSAREKNVRIMLPQDSVIAQEISDNAATRICKSNEIPDGWMGLDIGPQSIEYFDDIILNSQVVIWNGPMGVFEKGAFSSGTLAIAKTVGKATQDKGAFSLIGGGDSVAALKKLNMEEKVSYISTGGGAMLKYLEGASLPGIIAITEE